MACNFTELLTIKFNKMKNKILEILNKYSHYDSNPSYSQISGSKFQLISDEIVKLFAIPDVMVPVCPECENPYMHLYENGGGHCEDCGYSFKANEP